MSSSSSSPGIRRPTLACAGSGVGRARRVRCVAARAPAVVHGDRRLQIDVVVARDEETEFVECQLCGEVFDSIEYRDMILEEEESLLREKENA